MGFSLKKLGQGLSRAYDQVNMFDNNRTWQQRAPTQNKSSFQQLGQVGGQFARGSVGGTAKLVNTAVAQGHQIYDTGRMIAATKSHNAEAFRNANNASQYHYNQMKRGGGGLLNQGTVWNGDEAQKGEFKTGLRVFPVAAQSAAEIYSLGQGANVGGAIKSQGVIKGIQSQLPALGKSYLTNTAQGGLQTYNQGGKAGDIAKSALLSGVTGTVGDVGLGLAGSVIHPHVNNIAGKAYSSAKGKISANADKQLGIPPPLKPNQVIRDPKVFDSLQKMKAHLDGTRPMKPEEFSQVYSVLHAADKQHDLGGRFYNGSNEMKKQHITQFMENNGEAIKNGVGLNKPKVGLKEKLGISKMNQTGGIGIPDDVPTIKNSFGQEVPNPNYKPKSLLDQGGIRQSNDVQTQIELAHNAGDNVKVAKLIEGIQDPNLKSGMEATFGPPKVSSTIKAIREGKINKSSINTERLDLTPEQKIIAKADTTADIGVLSNKEVTKLAEFAGINTKKVGMAETKKIIAEQLNLRRKLVESQNLADQALAKGDIEGRAALLKQAAEEGSISRSQGTDIARQLQARKIMANELNTPWQKLAQLMNEAGVDPEIYSKRFAGVDLKDTKAVTKAYRELVPAKFGDWVEKYRYTNMLSSPLTHIVNATSNLTGSTVIAPIQKLYEGALDATRAGITGGKRTRFAGEAGASLGATIKSIPDAFRAFGDVMTGKSEITNPDFAQSLKGSRLAQGGFKGGVDTTLEFIPKLLEAADQFTMKMTSAGEEAGLRYRVKKGVDVNDIVGTANEAAKYRAFRQELGKKGQGRILEAIDYIPNKFLEAKKNPNPVISLPAKIVLPFITTPTNLFKQGLEYSPLGVTTLWGSANKTAQVAKMLMGTTAIATLGGTAAANDALTFSEPTSAAERDAFRAEGKQPYAIKIGGKWIGYSKLHPAISFNLALTAAVKDGLDKGTIDESGMDKVMRIGGGMMGYFTDQSYMKSIGDTVNIFKGGDGSSIGDAVSSQGTNIANQGVPFKSMVSWIGRMVDPTQRKVDYTANPMDQIYQGVVKDIPGLNEEVPARKNPYTGENLKNDNPVLNSFVPTRVTNDKGYGNTTSLNVEQRMAQKEMPEEDRKAFRSGIMLKKGVENLSTKEKEKIKLSETKGVKQLPNGKFFTKVGKEYKSFDSREDADIAVFKDKFKNSKDKSATFGDSYFYKTKKGKVVEKPKIQYEYEQIEASSNLDMDRALAKKDLDGWFAAADRKYSALESKKQLFDPETEADEINKIILQQENLREKADKYGAYGGFTKGSRSGGGGSNTIALKPGANLKSVGKVSGKFATKAPIKLKGSVKTASTGKPKVTIKKALT